MKKQEQPKDSLICKCCNGPYSVLARVRVYGASESLTGFCSAGCCTQFHFNREEVEQGYTPDNFSNMPKWDRDSYKSWSDWAKACFKAGENKNDELIEEMKLTLKKAHDTLHEISNYYQRDKEGFLKPNAKGWDADLDIEIENILKLLKSLHKLKK